VRLLDRMLSRSDYWEGMSSGAAVLTTTYGSPDRESILPQLTGAAQASFGSNSPVFSAIMVRISLLSQAVFRLQSVADKKLFGDQRLSVLEHPWPDGTAGDLIGRCEQDVSLAGNAFIWKAADDLLVRLRPEWVTIISELVPDPLGRQYRQVLGYWFDPPKLGVPGGPMSFGEPQFFTADEVAHWAPIPDPSASFRGMSWLTPIIRDLAADTGLTDYKVKYLSNAASPNLLIRYTQKLQPGTIDSLRERMQARYGGVDNSFKTLVLDQGADATVIGNSLQQMNFESVQQAGAERILGAANVPGVLIGMEPLTGVGRAYVEVVRRFADFWATPQWASLCGALQKLVPGMPPAGIRLWYDDTDISALQEGGMQQAQINLVHAQALLTLAQAGYTRESAVEAVRSSDLTQLEAAEVPPPQFNNPVPPEDDQQAVMPGVQQTQHLLPGGGGSSTTKPLPAGSSPRLAIGTTSPGDGGNSTRPSGRPASVRRN